jgi:hypothetical protein
MAGGQGRNTTNGRNGGRRITDSGDWVERSDLSIMDDIESDDESHTTNELVTWIKGLQMRIRKMECENNGLKEEIDKMKANAEKETSELIGRAQVQCERDERTYKHINTLVVEKVFSFKKFITSQKDLDDFSSESSLGMIVMDRMKIEGVDRLSFWSAYKEIVADAIANHQTTITNDLKKVVMSMYRQAAERLDQYVEERFSLPYLSFWTLQESKLTTRHWLTRASLYQSMYSYLHWPRCSSFDNHHGVATTCPSH